MDLGILVSVNCTPAPRPLGRELEQGLPSKVLVPTLCPGQIGTPQAGCPRPAGQTACWFTYSSAGQEHPFFSPPCVLSRHTVDWASPTHSRESHLPESIYGIRCLPHPETPSQTVQNNLCMNIWAPGGPSSSSPAFRFRQAGAYTSSPLGSPLLRVPASITP